MEELKKAQKFIFLEYFIIEPSYMWNSILSILKKKINEGVEVKVPANNVFYDLQGRQVLMPRKGIYILNGKKVLVK